MDIKPNFKWYEKIILYPVLIPYFAGKEFYEYLTVKRTITPLHKAATGKNNEAVILRLLAEGANINARDYSGATPLVYALRNQRFELAKLLLEKGAEVNVKDDIKATAMSAIGPLPDLETLKLMIRKGGNIHEQNDITEDTVIHLVCNSGHAHILDYLISAGAKSDINKVNYRGETPLHSCIRSYSKDKAKMVKLLVEQGADLKIKNRDGLTPILLAEAFLKESNEKNKLLQEIVVILKK